MTNSYTHLRSDVLVIGAGAAGCRAAIAAADAGASVTLIAKGAVGRSGTTPLAEVVYSAAMGHADPRDNPEIHFQDTIRYGRFIGNQTLARTMCYGGPQSILDADRYGMPWYKTADGKYVQLPSPGHTYNRGLHNDEKTGRMLLWALLKEVRNHPTITVIDDLVVTRLLTNGSHAVGAFAMNMKRNGYFALSAKATILATGGAGMMYQVNDMDAGSTGDGMVMAFRAGAPLIAMEMHQFFPTGFVYPESLRGTSVATSALWSRGLKLYNNKGERFMERYFPKEKENVPRDDLSRSIFLEILEGRGTEHGGVWLDTTEVEDFDRIKHDRHRSYIWPLRFGVDTAHFEIAPTYHFTLGGVIFDERARTPVPGLLLAGEVGGGAHGANRIAGNALTECMVFGAIAGETAADLRVHPMVSISEQEVEDERERIEKFRESAQGCLRPIQVRRKLQRTMYNQVGLVRNEKAMREALSEIERMRAEDLPRLTVASTLSFDVEWLEATELDVMLELAEVTTRAALLRSESRGAHYRSDYAKSDNSQWLRNTVATREGNTTKLSTEPVQGFFIPLPS